ncbi:MAG: type II secretion system protein F, partial [Rothia dentocariosa]|nr:type II secretion system protein F [Rothia dentocariosa]
MRSLYILLGLLLGSGLWLVISTFVRSRRSGFAERIAPQMRSVTVRESLSRETEETPTSLGAVLLVFFGPMLDRISSRMRNSSMTDESLRERLR